MTKRSLKSRIKRHVTKEFPNAVQENRKIIFFATLLFFLVVATAAVSGQFEGNPISRFVEGATEPSRELFKEEVEVDRSHTQLIFFYIKNNLVTAIESVGLGIAFGIFPLYAILINGLLIGYVITISEFSTLQILSLLVPHGVFELTAQV